jgi:2,3-bisphosphoglycerate-independent phosphoglycerate mutase
MKYVIVHGEGMADLPHRELGGRTPLQAAATPNMDELACKGEIGLAALSTEGLGPGRTVRQLTILGYDLHKYHSGPAPFEAASLGVALGEQDVVFRCSMVTLRSGASRAKASVSDEIKKLGPHVVMDDATAGGIETDEARELIDAVNEQLGSEMIQFYPGATHRHLMVWVGGKARAVCYDPREAVGRSIGEFLPSGDGAEILRQVMESTLVILRDHPVNEQRRAAGQKPANCLWLWGQGRAPKLPKLTERYRITGSVVSARELVRGIGVCAGLDAVNPAAGENGGGTDFLGLGDAAVREIGKKDLVYVHAKMPTDIARGTDSKAKLKVMEEFDRKTVGTIVEDLSKRGPHRLVLICDHVAADGNQHQIPPAPYVLYEGPGAKPRAKVGYNETDAGASPSGARDAAKLIARLLRGSG